MRWGLQQRILAGVLGCFLTISGLTAFWIARQAGASAREDARAVARSAAGEAAARLEGDFRETFAAVRALSNALEGMDRHSPEARRGALEMVRQVLEITPGALSAWVVYEPDAFDGKDQQHVGMNGFGEKGRFEGTFLRRDGQIRRTFDTAEAMLGDPQAGAWYRDPLQGNRETVQEPYSYDFGDGRKNLVTTVAVPIHDQGRPVGVVGMDLDLEALHRSLTNLRVLGVGRVSLFSPRGLFVSDPDTSLLGRSLSEVGNGKIGNLGPLLADMGAGKSFSLQDRSLHFGEEALKTHVPVSPGPGQAPWSLAVTLPLSFVDRTARALVRDILLASLAGALLMTLVVTLTVRRIVRPVKTLAEALNRFGDLDLTRDASHWWLQKQTGEIGEMTGALGRLQEALAHMMGVLQTESERCHGAAETLAGLSEESVASAEEIRAALSEASSLSQTGAAALDEARTGTTDVAAGAADAARFAAEAAEASSRSASLSEEAADRVEATLGDLTSLQDRFLGVRDRAARVEEASRSIGSFVGTIRGIAEQTNLLALNAAIEAARAGTAGRGFAVVAEEVRKLAAESQDASVRIADLVEQLREESRDTLEVASEAQTRMERLQQTSRSATERLRTALEQIGRVDGSVQNLAATSQEQAAASQQMAASIDQVARITEEVARNLEGIGRASEDTASAAEQVAVQSQSLAEGSGTVRDLLRRFRLDREAPALSGSPGPLPLPSPR